MGNRNVFTGKMPASRLKTFISQVPSEGTLGILKFSGRWQKESSRNHDEIRRQTGPKR
jgi:hypothetical protein